MEEKQTEKELFELRGHLGAVEEGWLADRRDLEGIDEVGSEALRCLICHFHSVL